MADKPKMARFVSSLLKKMTLDEKIGQLNLAVLSTVDTGTVKSLDVDNKILSGHVGGLFGVYSPEAVLKQQKLAVEKSRLGIPLLFGLDVIHGHKTIFPIPLGLSCSWDMKLIEGSARTAAREATADGLNWAFSPMVDISRDPRWGRVAEGAGEDAYLGARIAAAMIRGLQGDDLSRADTILACVKHLGLYGAVEGGRDYNNVDMSPLRMHEDYLPPFEAAVKAGAGSIMTAFNDINGMPATANKTLFRDILRDQWGFDGLTVTDYTAINELTDHGLGDLKTVSTLALKAGIDMDMVGEGFLTTLKKSLQTGNISEADIDMACRRVLEVKYRLGLFDDPYRYISPEKAQSEILTKENLEQARAAAAKSCVLLKNNDQVLPLKKNAKIALIGPLADDQHNMLGTWSIAGDWQKSITVMQGIKNVAGTDADILYAKGANITNDRELAARVNFNGEKIIIDPRPPQEMIDEAVAMADLADVIVAVVGEGQEMSGECASRADIGIPEAQKDLLKALKRTGKPLVLVTMSGRPLTLGWEDENADAIFHTWFGGIEAGNGIADVLFGALNPSGKLTMSFPRHVGQVPIYYNHKTTGRPLAQNVRFEKFKSCYLDVPNTPLYPFGYGLSYTNFAYSPVHIDKVNLKGEKDVLSASVRVKNTGPYAGEEVVQLYVTDPVASLTRPVKTLRAFEKIMLRPGQEKTVTFQVTTEDLKFYNEALEHDWEPGEFIIHIGTNSDDTKTATANWEKDSAKTPPSVRARTPGI